MPTLEEQIKAQTERAQALVAQTEAEGDKAFAGSSFEQALSPETRAITAQDLEPITPITPPEPKIDMTNYDALINGGNAQIGANATQSDTDTTEPTSDLDSRIKALQDSFGTAPPSLEEAFKTAEAGSGIDIAKENARIKQAQVRQAQAQLAGVQAQIQAVVDKRDANFLKMEKDAENRLITTGVLSRQQAEVNRQAAIEALPLQALALAAQARVQTVQGEAEFAQSTLKAAQDKLDTAFQLKSKDIENAYNFAKENRDRVYNFLTAEQKTRADALQKQDDRNFTLSRDAISIAQSAVKQAMDAGQADLAAKITQLPHPDIQNKTFTQDLAKYNADIASLQGQIQVKAPKQDLQFISGTANQPSGVFNKATGEFTPTGGIAPTPKEVSAEFKNIVSGISNLVSSASGAKRGEEVGNGVSQALIDKDFASAYAQIANGVEAVLTGTSKNRFANSRTDFAVMSGMRDAIQEYADGGGDMGLLTGKAEEIQRKLGIDSGEASALAVQLWREFQTYRNIMTGAAFTPAESADYAAVNPTLGKSLDLNLSVIDGALNQIENRIISTINVRVPDSQKIYDLATGTEAEEIDPIEAPVGAIIDFDGFKYRKVGEDQYEEI